MNSTSSSYYSSSYTDDKSSSSSSSFNKNLNNQSNYSLNPNHSGINFGTSEAAVFDGTGCFFSAAELEFMAENFLIQIKPKKKMEAFHLLTVKPKQRNEKSF